MDLGGARWKAELALPWYVLYCSSFQDAARLNRRLQALRDRREEICKLSTNRDRTLSRTAKAPLPKVCSVYWLQPSLRFLDTMPLPIDPGGVDSDIRELKTS